MYEFKVNNKVYKIKFNNWVLSQSNVMDHVLNVSEVNAKEPSKWIRNIMGITSELLLAGLQKHHEDEFGYDFESESEYKAMLKKASDLVDDYEEENRSEEIENQKDAFTLFNDLQHELEKNSFLSRLSAAGEKAAAEQKATVLPTDHKRKIKKVGEKQ